MGGGPPQDTHKFPSASRPHHQRLLQQGWAVCPGCQPRLHPAPAGQGNRGAAGRVRAPSTWPCAPPPWGGGGPYFTPSPPKPSHRYTGHRSTTYRLDCVLSEQDTHVGSASEDGNVYFWDLVEVSGQGEAKPALGGVPGEPPHILTPPPQGSLVFSLAVGRGVVQSLSFHPTLPCLLTATEGQVQLWREESFQPEGDAAT